MTKEITQPIVVWDAPMTPWTVARSGRLPTSAPSATPTGPIVACSNSILMSVLISEEIPKEFPHDNNPLGGFVGKRERTTNANYKTGNSKCKCSRNDQSTTTDHLFVNQEVGEDTSINPNAKNVAPRFTTKTPTVTLNA